MATIPSQTTLAVGAVLTSAVWNANVRDAVNYLLTPPMAVLRQTVAQSAGAGGYTAVTWDTEDRDSDNGHSTISNTSRYTAQTMGWYIVQSTINWPGSTSGNWLGITLQVNGSTRYSKQATGTSTVFNAAHHTGTQLFLNAGDYVDTLAANGTGNAYLLTSSDGFPRTAIRWVSTA